LMSGSVSAPWLLAFGALMVASAILTNQDIWNYIYTRIQIPWKKVLLFTTICVLFFVPTLLLCKNVADNQRAILSRTPIFYGELTPGNELKPPYPAPTPPPGQVIPEDAFRIMLGDRSSIYIDGPVDNAFYFKGRPFLTIRTNTDGTVVLNTEVLDSTNNKIVKIIDNEFQANPDYAFHPRQPDKHSLVVRDSEGVEVLNIKYLNPKVIWITGRFFSPPDSQPVTILPSGVIDYPDIMDMIFEYMPASTGEHIFLGPLGESTNN
jgi:hypothetical protein